MMPGLSAEISMGIDDGWEYPKIGKHEIVKGISLAYVLSVNLILRNDHHV
jgi:hypothetical protein